MATSGSFDFNLDRNGIINMALRKVGAVPIGNSPSARQISDAADALNVIVKALQNRGIHLSTLKRVDKPFTKSSEVLGTDAKNYRCILSHTSASSDQPITGSNFSTFWFQDGTSGVTWVTGTAYGAIGDFDADSDVLDIQDAHVRDGNDDFPLRIRGLIDYQRIPNKHITGMPHTLYLDKGLTPHIFLHPQPDDVANVLHYTKARFIEDFDASTHNPDTRVLYLDSIMWILARDLAPEYRANTETFNMLRSMAREKFKEARDADREGSTQEYVQGYLNYSRFNVEDRF